MHEFYGAVTLTSSAESTLSASGALSAESVPLLLR